MSKREQTPGARAPDAKPSAAERAAHEVEIVDDSDLIAEPGPNDAHVETRTTAVDLPAGPIDREPWIGVSHVEAAPEPMSAFEFEPPPPAASPAAIPAPRLRIALGLFVLTFISATAVHLMLMLEPGSLRELIELVRSDPTMLRPALIFSLALMGILLIHDLGHSLASLAGKVQQSYPYYLPLPAVLGTLGSVVFLRTEPPHRSSLLRMAVMGPIAGMAVAIPLAAYGLSQSLPLDVARVPPGSTWLGNSLLFTWLAEAFSPNGVDVQLHPLAFAGWVGMFVTSINLLPAAQLDGGHVARAVLGRGAPVLSLITVVALFGYGFYLTLSPRYGTYAGAPWLLWATLIFIAGLGHPRVRDPKRPLRTLDWLGTILAIAIAVLTFVPVPVQIVPADPSQAEFLERGRDGAEDEDWSVEESDLPPETFDL